MYAEPIRKRIDDVLKRGAEVKRLMEYGWTDAAIANYIGTDKITVRRCRCILRYAQWC